MEQAGRAVPELTGKFRQGPPDDGRCTLRTIVIRLVNARI